MMLLRWAGAWVLYALGHLCSIPSYWEGDYWAEIFYPAYNKLMCWSVDVQDSGAGPWSKCGEKDGYDE